MLAMQVRSAAFFVAAVLVFFPFPALGADENDFPDLPPHVIRIEGDWEWHLWFLGFGGASEQAHGRLYHDGREVPGAEKGEGISCDLGDFLWNGSLANAAWTGGMSGWLPADGRGIASHNRSDLRERHAITRSEPRFRREIGGDLWLQWFYGDFPEFGKSGFFGALRIDGKWLPEPSPDAVSIATRFGEIVPAGEDGRGWLSASPASRLDFYAILADVRTDPGLVGDMIAAGANVNRSDSSGSPPLLLTVSHQDGMWLWLGSRYPEPTFAEMLLGAGASVNGRDGEGKTALMASVSPNGNPKVTRALVAAGADVDARDLWGNTALHYAVESRDDLVAVRVLLAAGADPDAEDENRHRPLYHALSSRGNLDAAFALVDAGADVDAPEYEGARLADADEEFVDLALAKAVLDRAAKRDAGSGVAVMSMPEVDTLLSGTVPGYDDSWKNAPAHTRRRPDVVLREGNAKWRYWTPGGWGGYAEGSAGKLYVDNAEVVGTRRGERIECALGTYVWHGAYGDKTRTWQECGWLPEVRETLAVEAAWQGIQSRVRMSGFSRSEGRYADGCLWRQYRDAEGRIFGELIVDNEWLDGDGLEPGVSRIDCALGEFVWHGDAAGAELSGWLSADPLLRHDLGVHIAVLKTPAEGIRTMLDWGAGLTALYPARLNDLTTIDPYHEAILERQRENDEPLADPMVDALILALMHGREAEVIRTIVLHPRNFSPESTQSAFFNWEEEDGIPPATMFAAWYAEDPEIVGILVLAGDEYGGTFEFTDASGELRRESASDWAKLRGNLKVEFMLQTAQRLEQLRSGN